MCSSCWAEYGKPTEMPDNGDAVVALIRELYDQPDGGAGGPLHVVLDDWNLEDGHLDPYLGSDDWTPRTWELAVQISAALAAMPLMHRVAVLAREMHE